MKINFITVALFSLMCISARGGDDPLKSFCPMSIVPGKSIGPLSFETSLDSAKKMFPKAKLTHVPFSLEQGKMDFISSNGLNISFCKGKAQDIWIEFGSLGEVHDGCLTYEGKKVPLKSSLKALRKFFGGCLIEYSRHGGTFFECGSGIWLGASGPNLSPSQIRIGQALDVKCPIN